MQFHLSFFGAAQNVTGSQYLLQANGKNILIDCGLYQEHDLKERNWADFKFPPAELPPQPASVTAMNTTASMPLISFFFIRTSSQVEK